jgi:hypothetical protein
MQKMRSRRLVFSLNNFVNLQHKSSETKINKIKPDPNLTSKFQLAQNSLCTNHCRTTLLEHSAMRKKDYTQKKPLAYRNFSKTRKKMKFLGYGSLCIYSTSDGPD